MKWNLSQQHLNKRGENREISLQEFLENEVWPLVPADQIGKRLTRAEEALILGYTSGKD